MISAFLKSASNALFIPVDQISAALCLLLSFPFAFLLHWVFFVGGSRTWRNSLINILTVGPTYLFLWICFFVARQEKVDKLSLFIWDLLSVHIPILGVFLALKWSPWMRQRPTLIFILLLLQLSYHHLSRQISFYNQYTVNVTGPLMMLVIKLSAFAYDVSDGKIGMEGVRFGRFMAWALLFAGFFTGPVVMYKEFHGFCENPHSLLEQDDDHVDDEKKKKKFMKNLSSSNMHSHALAGRKRMATFLILSASLLLIFGLLLQPHFPIQNLLTVVSKSDNNQNSLIYRIVFMHLALLGWRIKYYVAWSLAEGALVIIGLGWIVKDGKIKWNRYQNVNFLAIETTCDFRTIIGEWNVSTNQWLNQYIYQRLGRTFYANLTTYLVSAFWHGFYPGYYLTFLSGALYTALTRLIYKSFTWPLKQKYRRVLLYVPNYLLVNYFAAPFALQTFQDSWEFCKAWGFYGHVVMIAAFILIKILKKREAINNNNKRNNRKNN